MAFAARQRDNEVAPASHVIAGSLLVFIPSLGAFIAPDLLGGGRNLMIGNLIALQFQGSRNWPFGSAAAVILMTVVLIALLVYIRQQSRMFFQINRLMVPFSRRRCFEQLILWTNRSFLQTATAVWADIV